MNHSAPKQHIEKIKSLLPYKSYKEIAEIMGSSINSVYYYAKKFNLRGIYGRERYKELDRIVKENWATHSCFEIAKMAGCKWWQVIHAKDRLGLKRTEEETAKLDEKKGKNISKALLKNVERDRRRMKFGLEPISKTLMTIAPKHILQVGYNLQSHHGYKLTDDPYVMSRNGHSLEGNRRGCDEAYYTKRYGITFID